MTQTAGADKPETTVEQKQIALAILQRTLSEIDKIRKLRGELPLEVQDLEDEIAGMETRLANFTADNKTLSATVTQEKTKASKAKDLIEKYKAQLDMVRNNKEYDNLQKEIEFQELEVQLSEKKLKENNAEIQGRKVEIASLKEHIEERKSDLEAKKSELDAIISETKQDEETLHDQAKELEKQIEPRLLLAFKRIRKGARNGLAVVPVDRGACGGCFNKIPPQRQLDVKLHKKIIVCEYCGRIMIDPELIASEADKKQD
ncbi:zinc ribbon domain protein [Porphyromonas crevioricanis]|uniref:Zinc ribbon domain protein n=1 Tax=Porphyromonas crevioricanis TaxID=393921 RepID=A0AB34PI47_9PORP|nr:zinc ribbon domain protein [Porphyromonas crevioricanis]KGN95940.1 zinc ribbon domain protein [Porphyromonas crevioricanis]